MVEAVGEANALEAAVDGISGRNAEASRGLIVLLQQRLLSIGQIRGIAAGKLVVLRRVVVVLVVEDLESEVERTVAEIWLVEAEEQCTRNVAGVGLHAQRFTESEEVVGLVVKTDEGPAEAADAAIEADGVLALLLDFQEQIDGAVFGVLVSLGVLLDLQRIEIVELVQTQKTQLPEMAVVDRALFEQQFAANDEIARYCIALELDARDIEGLALIDIDVEGDGLFRFVDAGSGDADEVDVAELTVGFLQVLQAFAEDGGVEPIAVLDGELAAQRLDVGDCLIAAESDCSQTIARAFIDRHRDVDALALSADGRSRRRARFHCAGGSGDRPTLARKYPRSR